MDQETASLPADTTAEAGAQPSDQAALPADTSQTEGQQPEGQTEGEQPPKKEKTEAEREIARLRRRVDNLTRQKYEIQARAAQPEQQQPAGQTGDDEPVSLTKAELQALIDQRAREVAPTIQHQQAEAEHRKAVVENLAKTWGQEKFDALAADLDDALGGLADPKGLPKPAAQAILEAEAPQALIEYLADPDNADEAAAIGRMGAVQAGRAIGHLEARLAASKASSKPQPSKAAPPIESIRGAGTVQSNYHALSDDGAWFAARQKATARRA